MTTSADQAMGPRGGASAVHSGQTGQVGRQANGSHIPLLGVLVVAVWQASVHHALDRMSQISFMAVILTMSVRQFLVLADHFNLSHQLEVKVEERTLELQHQAYHDGLTGLANRALFNRYLDDA